MNPMIERWLDDGKIKETLLGEGDYCLEDYKLNWAGGHDVLYAIQQILEWSRLKNKIPEVSREFESVVLELCSSNIALALRILICYDLCKDSKVRLVCDFGSINSKCMEILKQLDCTKYTPEELHTIRSSAKSLARYWPSIFKALGPIAEKLK